MASLATARAKASCSGDHGLSPNSGRLTQMKLYSGKKSTLPAGIVMVRSTVPCPPGAPARNQTDPDWPLAALAPVRSSSGLSSLLNESAHSHHSSLPAESTLENCGGKTP